MAETGYIEDLTPLFADGCWLFVLMAREANVAVILRRGPSKWVRATLWDTKADRFQPGQWFHGRIYPERCDLSADGKLFIYFAGKFRQRDQAAGYDSTWIAVSRPPYLTALALWPIGDTWGGDGVFVNNQTVLIATSSPSFGGKHHPNHPPGPLKVVEYCSLKKDDALHACTPCWRDGWERVLSDAPHHQKHPR